MNKNTGRIISSKEMADFKASSQEGSENPFVEMARPPTVRQRRHKRIRPKDICPCAENSVRDCKLSFEKCCWTGLGTDIGQNIVAAIPEKDEDNE